MSKDVVFITKQQDGKFIKPMAIETKTFEARKHFYSRDGWIVAPLSLISRYYDVKHEDEDVQPEPKPKKAKKEEEKQP